MAQTCSYCRSSMNNGDVFCQTCGRQAPSANGLEMLPESPEPAVAAVPTGSLPSWASSGHSGGLPSAPPTRSVPSAAAAPGGANEMYMGRRLVYSTTPEPTFDPLGNSRFLAYMWQRLAMYALVGGLVSSVLFFLFIVSDVGTFVSYVSNSANNSVNEFGGTVASAGSGSPVNGFAGFLAVVFILFGLVMTLCFWFLKIPIQLSEWKLTVDGKAGAAPMVFNHIATVLYGRRTPIEPMRVQRFRLPQTGMRDYLELHSHIFYGYVACFPYGQDLYIGWTFWSRLSPFRYVCMFIARIFQTLFGRGNDLYISLRYDSARALRETIHSATREGVDVAVGRLEAFSQGIVGSAIPVTEHAGTE
jgi:hypothetical protein